MEKLSGGRRDYVIFLDSLLRRRFAPEKFSRQLSSELRNRIHPPKLAFESGIKLIAKFIENWKIIAQNAFPIAPFQGASVSCVSSNGSVDTQ